MPGGMSGVELADAARLIAPDIRIILMIGYAGGHLPSELSGNDRRYEVIYKPFEFDDLAKKLEGGAGVTAT